MNPYRLPRLLAFVVAAASSVTALALVLGERADIEGMRFHDHPVLLLVGIVGALVAVPLCRWLYRKEDRWELADVPGWEEEVEAEASESAINQPIDPWERTWPVFWAVMFPPVGVVLGIRAVRRASARDRSWAVGSLTVACILTVLPIILIIGT